MGARQAAPVGAGPYVLKEWIRGSQLTLQKSTTYYGKTFIDTLITMAMFAAWILFAMAVGSVIVLRRKHPEWERPYRVAGYPWTALVFVVVWFLMRDRPADVGLAPYGQAPGAAPVLPATAMAPLAALATASRTPAFWILAGTFFICGASTNGLIGTHLISACHDVGISPIRSTQLLAMMGIFDILGTTASGWLTDRYSARHLLFAYYSLRGLSLLFLPATLIEGGLGLGVFAVFYGLDWIATVPPTVKLTTEAFGRENTGVIYGWIGASHQLGASMAAFGAGAIRTELGDYRLAFLISGVLCLIAGASFIVVGRYALRPQRERLQTAPSLG